MNIWLQHTPNASINENQDQGPQIILSCFYDLRVSSYHLSLNKQWGKPTMYGLCYLNLNHFYLTYSILSILKNKRSTYKISTSRTNKPPSVSGPFFFSSSEKTGSIFFLTRCCFLFILTCKNHITTTKDATFIVRPRHIQRHQEKQILT